MIRQIFFKFLRPVTKVFTRRFGSDRANIEINEGGRPLRRRDLAALDPRLTRRQKKAILKARKNDG